MLEQLLVADLAVFFLVFCRLGSAMLVLPGFGDMFVSPRVRLLLALAVSLVAAPVVGAALPPLPNGLLGHAGLVLTEIGVGLFLGISARLMISALAVAGTVIAFQTSLANAFAFDPMAAQQGAITSSFLTMLGVVLVFVTDLHHLMLIGLIDSYAAFVPGAYPPAGDFAHMVARIVADSFRIGLQLAAPFVLVGILVSLGMGLLARLMPQVQIFFVAMPVQIILGLLMIGLTLSVGMTWFLGAFEANLSQLFLRG